MTSTARIHLPDGRTIDEVEYENIMAAARRAEGRTVEDMEATMAEHWSHVRSIRERLPIDFAGYERALRELGMCETVRSWDRTIADHVKSLIYRFSEIEKLRARVTAIEETRPLNVLLTAAE